VTLWILSLIAMLSLNKQLMRQFVPVITPTTTPVIATSTPVIATTTVIITPATTTPNVPVVSTSTPEVSTSTATTTSGVIATTTSPVIIPTPAPVPVVSGYGLNQNTTVVESDSLGNSANSNWWVNSGGYFYINNGIGKTVQGSLPTTDKWQQLYASSNALDTDNGFHPQNIFRLVTKSSWKNYTEQGYFKINAYNESASPNRAEHNGFLFFNRYQDGQNLYYTGIRVDGYAVIKKKLNSTYYTMDYKRVFPGTYNRTSNPNLIPKNVWIGLRSVVKDNPDGTVSIKVYADLQNNGTWALIAEATDNGSQYGPVISASASAGIRTDFMDVEVKDYSVMPM
jgi:hypothetical protein